MSNVFSKLPYRDGSNGEPTKKRKAVKPGPSSTERPITASDIEPPIEKAHPGLQPALVFASYPLALLILVSVAAIYFFFFNSLPKGSEGTPTKIESAGLK